MSQRNQQITAAPLTIDGVSELDPEGRIPLEQLTNGTTIRISRWPRFPVPPEPGKPTPFSILRVFWIQDGSKTTIFEKTYTYVDDQPEFPVPLSPQQMSVDGVAFIYYELEGYDGNLDPSPQRKLTINHTVLPTLREPEFPDVNFDGYLNCSSDTPIWEKVRVRVLPEVIFQAFDKCVLEWQGFGSLNGSPPELTPLYKFEKTLNESDAVGGFVMEIPFEPYVRPMVNDDSGLAKYTVFRNGIPLAKSHTGVVKIDRTLPGKPPCGGAP
jgi:hypothetical protein